MTSSFKFWQKLNGRDSSEEISGFDLFYQLIYMSAVASAGISRSRIFLLGSELSHLPAKHFKRIQLLSGKLSYDYPTACRMVGAPLKSKNMKSLLLRLADALMSGRSEADFLEREAQIAGEAYANEYERDLAALTKWTDAYASIVISAALIVIVNLVSSLIYNMGKGMIIGLVVVAVLTSLIGAWTLSRVAPDEVKGSFSKEGPRGQRLSLKFAKILPPAALIISAFLALLGIGLGWSLIVAALLLLPLGWVSLVGNREMAAKDSEISSFLRSLGEITSSTGTTIVESLERLDLDSSPVLKADVEKLRRRLTAAVDPKLCWRKFSLETGSKLISESTTVFIDAVNLGADPANVGRLCGMFAARVVSLREKRQVVSSTFVGLTLIMHGLMAALIISIVEILDKFMKMIESAQMGSKGVGSVQSLGMPSSLLSFNSVQTGLLNVTTTGMIIVLIMTNAYAIIATTGEHRLKISTYVCILLALSGVGFIFVPSLVQRLM